ncbi:MAG: class I SAM-dependent methyltransferase [Methanotrichaceae archaeon]
MYIDEENRMRLGNFEFLAMNNCTRRFIQKHYEMRIFENMLNHEGINLHNSKILDAGCGSGYSTKLILEIFKPSKIIAFDYMPEQIALAKKRELPVDFFVGDMRKTDLPDSGMDAVFIFGVLHHIPNWETALKEIARTLKKQGVLLVEEPKIGFSWRSFERGLKESGFSILQKRSTMPFYIRSYLCQKK